MSSHHDLSLSFAHRASKLALNAAWVVLNPFEVLFRKGHESLMQVRYIKDWRFGPNPEWFNHEYDLVRFAHERKPHFFERGVYAQEVCKPGMNVLDLCSGDGSVAALFLSPNANKVLAVDFDKSAIEYSRTKWADYKNVEYRVADIRQLNVTPGSFDLVCWDAAIEHFTQEEMDKIFHDIKASMKPNALLHGSTPKKNEDGKAHHDHEYEFSSVEELKEFLSKKFKNVMCWERAHPDRTNFYFRCTDSDTPLAVQTT